MKFDDAGHISELALSGTFGGEASVGIEQFFGGTNADSQMPESFSLLALNGGAEVTFDAKLDLQDPIVQQQAAELLNSMGSGGVSLTELQDLLGESSCRCRSTRTSTGGDKWDIGIAALEISETERANLVHVGQAPRRRLHARVRRTS